MVCRSLGMAGLNPVASIFYTVCSDLHVCVIEVAGIIASDDHCDAGLDVSSVTWLLRITAPERSLTVPNTVTVSN